MSNFQKIICGMLLIIIMGGLWIYSSLCSLDKTLVSGATVLLTYVVKKVLDMFEDLVLGPGHDTQVTMTTSTSAGENKI